MPEETTHFGYQTIPITHKTARVRSLFRSVANRYDLMNDLMSFGLHRLWKRIAINKCKLMPNDWVLDLAGGTGDLTQHLAKKLGKKGNIILADINEFMLAQARIRLINQGILAPVSYMQLNAETLPFPNTVFDCITISFGLRNVTHKAKALSEMQRVLKPQGRAVILEFSKVSSEILNTLYNAYSFNWLPKLGKWIAQDEASYRYLAESIRMHPDQETLKSMLLEAGFTKCEYQNLHQGIVAIHIGYKD